MLITNNYLSHPYSLSRLYFVMIIFKVHDPCPVPRHSALCVEVGARPGVDEKKAVDVVFSVTQHRSFPVRNGSLGREGIRIRGPDPFQGP